MKRPVFIVIGAVLVLILLVTWVYMLFFSKPANNNDEFANLNLGNTDDPTAVITTPESEEPVVNFASPKKLRQLTFQPIAGYREIKRNASSSPEIIYIGAGTGHIFSIDIDSGAEDRISATTIPSSYKGDITPDGNYVLIQSGSGPYSEYIIGQIDLDNKTLSNKKLDEAIISFAATLDNTFLYAVQTGVSVIGKEYDPATETSNTLFTIPFREASFVWGETASDAHYVYPRASHRLEGFLLKIEAGDIERLPIAGYGLSAVGNNFSVVYSSQVDQEYQTSYSFVDTSYSFNPSPITYIPEKCTFTSNTSYEAICAGPYSIERTDLPDAWYQGTITYSDNLWSLNTEIGSAGFLTNTKDDSGRDLDITNLSVGKSTGFIYFTNKIDSNLWLFERN